MCGLRDLLDYPISIGTVHNRVQEIVPVATKINKSADLSPINVASLDEIFHSNRPILTGQVFKTDHSIIKMS